MPNSDLYSKLLHTVTPAMATPIDITGLRVSEKDVAPLVEFLIERSVGGLFTGGSTGEGLLLSLDERKKLHEATVTAAAGRLPVLAHVGCNTTRESFDLAVHAAEIGADALVAVTPWFFPIPNAALVEHFKTIANAAPQLPLLVYDIPHFANNGITPELVKMLAQEVPSYAGVKCSRRDAQMVRRLIDASPEGTLILAGNEQILLGSLAMGAHGAISGLSTAVPEPFVNMVSAWGAGNINEARAWANLYNRILANLSAHPRLGYIKAILNQRGIYVGDPIAPRPVVSADVWQQTLDIIESA